MRTHKIPPLRGLFLLFILSVALLTVPDWARAHHEQLALAPSTTEMQEVVAEAPKTEGSKSKSTGHGSPKGMMGSPHGKTEGSGSKHGYGKGYSHGSKHGYGKKEGSHGRGYGKHGYSRYGYGGHGYRSGHGGHGKDPFRHVLRFAKPLGLTEAQIGQIKNMKFEFAKMRIMLKARHQVAHLELDKLVHSGEVKEAEMRAVADRMAQIKSKKIHSMVEAKIGLLKLMTPEQRKKISKLHSKH
ncbi:MAG: Spy/CpxP family protein refolding chaperone [Nitrospinae bacterium]|nr:Spy/CpxP family protein refolding chaperone [Nitrospinota bacterium]